MRSFNKHSLTVILFLFSFLGIIAQEFKNEEDRKKHADKLFDKGKYVEATPHILHFLSLNQTSPEYNFKYGVCLMYSDEDKEKSLRYLKFSASKGGGGDSRVYFFLGKSFHLNYNFKEALKNYQKFQKEGEDNYKIDLEVDLHIKMCQNGKQLLQKLTELVVYEKTESSFERFQYSYDLKEIGGNILVSEEFQSKYDKKMEYKSVVYFPPLNQDILFFSSYGKDGSTGLDLYLVKREASGGFGSPQKLPETINTPYDDAYGFLHADGKTFYFSSKGHTSMGGYDVFKVDYEPQTNQFGTPKNLDYKINTPDDDIMYIVDPNFENAYFSSSRAAKGGFLDVYKVKVETFPIVNVILAGKFQNKINTEDIAATIKVENTKTGEIEGIYNPDNGGNYIIVLPRSGKYKLIVETPGSEKIHTGMIDVPAQKVMRPLKQTLDLVNDGGVEKLVINNLFDQELENADEIMAKVLKGMSDPDPNSDNFPDSLYTQLNQEDVVSDALDENYSVDDLIGLSADKAKEVQEEANELKKRMEAAYTVANNKSNAAKEITKQADNILKEVEAISNPLEKQEKIELAKKAHSQSKDLNLLATTALNLANALKTEYDKKQKEATDANKVAIEIEKAVNENSHEKAISALKDLQSRIDELIDDKQNYKSGFDEIVQKAKLKQEEADQANVLAQEYRAADDELNLRKSTLERDFEKAKSKDKPLIQRQIDDIGEQLLLNDELAKESFEKSNVLQKEADILNHQVDLMSNLFDDIDAGTSVELTAEEKQQVKDYLASNELNENISKNENNLKGYDEGENTASAVSNNNSASSDVETNQVLSQKEKDDIIASTKEEFNEYEKGLQELEGSSESKEFQESKQEVIENWMNTINSKINEATTELSTTTASKEKLALETKLGWLSKEKENKEKELSDITEVLAQLEDSTNNVDDKNTDNNSSESFTLSEEEKNTIRAEEKENYLSYEEELATISKSGTEQEVAIAQKNVNENWITALDGEIMDTEDQIALTSDPKEKKIAEEKLAWLNDQKAKKEIDLNFIEEELASLDEASNSNNDQKENNTSTLNEEDITITSEEKENLIAVEKKKFNVFENNLLALENKKDLESIEEKTRIIDNWVKELKTQISNAEKEYESSQNEKEKLELSTKLDWLKGEEIKRQSDFDDYEVAIADLKQGVTIDTSELINENQKAEDWLSIIDKDINDLEVKIENEEDEVIKEDLITQKENLVKLREEKLSIVETNTNALEKSTAQKELETTEEYKELTKEIENTSSTALEYDRSFANNLDYKSVKALDLIADNSTKVDEILVIEQELEQLETQLQEEKKEKKKEGIQKQIDKKNETKTELELAISDNIKLIDEAEFTANQKNIEELVSEAKALNNSIVNDQNYQSAKLIEEKYITQNNEAKQLLVDATSTDDKSDRVEKLKEAHAIQQAAINNQKEAKTLLSEMLLADYEPTLIGKQENLLVENNQVEVKTIDDEESLTEEIYLSNQKEKSVQLTKELNALPNEEKITFLTNWKTNLDLELNKNMKLLTSEISDEEKEVISQNVEFLRNEKQSILAKQDELSNLADNSEENTVTLNNSNTDNTYEANNSSTNEDSNSPVENTSNNSEATNNTESNNTVEQNNNSVIEDNNSVEQNTILVTDLTSQKKVFESFNDQLNSSKNGVEKANLFKEWIGKIEEQLEENKEAINGNITVNEEAIIQSKIDWLEEEKKSKEEQLEELENQNIANNSTSNDLEVKTSKVSKEVITNSKVKDEVEGISFYSANEKLTNYDVSTNVETKDLTSQVEFNSQVANEIIRDNESKISKVKSYETLIENLEVQRNEVTDDKLVEKIDKKVEKAIVKKSKSELKLTEEFKTATEEDDLLVESNLLETKSLLTNSTDVKSFAYQQAKEYEEKAEELKNEANQLRSEAAGIKSVTEKNKMINNALSKEKASIEFKKKASKLYSEAVVNNFILEDKSLESISEKVEERPSFKILAAADKADNLAYEYNTRAGELRDSAITVKKKNKSKVIQEAEVYSQKYEAQKLIAQKLKQEGTRVQEKEAEVLENELLLTNLSEKDVEQVRSLENYDKIYNNQSAIDAFLKELKLEEEMMKSYKSLANQQDNKASEYKERAKSTKNEEERQKLNELSVKLIEKANENRAKQDSVGKVIAQIKIQKETLEQEQFDLISLFDEEFQNDIKGLLLSNYEKTPLAKKEAVEKVPNLALDNLTSSNYEAPEVLNTNIVVINNDRVNSVYSESNPIPVNPKNPKGLVYKVQVGAFRKPIPQDLFKGFAPISAEKIRDDITRYRVGYFMNFETANVSKNQIRGLGYPDAFVVAILNGERVSMAQARSYANNPNTDLVAINNSNTQVEDNNSTTENLTVENTVVENNTTTDNSENTEVANNNTAETETVPDYVQNLDENAAEVNAVENMKGLFYTVQVGAFSKPIPKTGAFNISPLVTKYVNGLYKYTTGIYKSVLNADVRKNEVREKGIPDAFVIAYYNGERISLIEASEIIRAQGEAAFSAKAEGENTQPINNVSDAEELNLNETNPNQNNQRTPTEIIPTRITPELAKSSYLTTQKNQSQLFEKEFEGANLEKKKEVLLKWNSRVESETNRNTKLLVSDLPDVEKEVINENITWLKAEKFKIQNKEKDVNNAIEAKKIAENEISTESPREVSEYAKPSYLKSQKEEAATLETNLALVDNGTKKQILNERNSRLEEELTKNMKLLATDIPDEEKDVINENVVWLKTEKDKVITAKEAIYNAEKMNELKDETPSQTNIEGPKKVSEYAKPSYLTDQKNKSITLENQLTNSSLSKKDELLVERATIIDSELKENMKQLVSDIPAEEKEVINENVTWLRAEKAKVKKQQLELINEAQVVDPISENNTTEVSEDIEKRSTFYIDLGIYYGTVPTPIAEALLTNKQAKVKRNKINDSATQYYCGVFLTKDEVAAIWASFVEQGLTDAKIIEIKYDQEFILMEKDEEEEIIPSNNNNLENNNNSITVVNTKLIYRVELGTFDGTMPTTIGRVFLELGYLGIEKVKSNNQETYYCGKVDTKEKANELKQKFIEKGISEAKTVAFVGERKISLTEADELSK